MSPDVTGSFVAHNPSDTLCPPAHDVLLTGIKHGHGSVVLGTVGRLYSSPESKTFMYSYSLHALLRRTSLSLYHLIVHFAHQWFWCCSFTLQQEGAPHSVHGPAHGSILKRRLQAAPISQALAYRETARVQELKDGLGRDCRYIYTQHLSHMAAAGRISKTKMSCMPCIYTYAFCPCICLLAILCRDAATLLHGITRS